MTTMGTRARLITVKELKLEYCPICSGSGSVAPEEVDRFREVQILAAQTMAVEARHQRRDIKCVLLGMLAGVMLAASVTWLWFSILR